MFYKFLFATLILLNTLACSQYKTLRDSTVDGTETAASTPVPLPDSSEVQFEDDNPQSPIVSLKTEGSGDLKLGDKKVINVEYVISLSYSGKIDFSFDRSALANIAGESDVLASVSPNTIEATPGQTINLEVTLESRVKAPSFDSTNLVLIARPSSGEAISANIPLRVSAILEIQMNACDFQNNQTLDECWNRPGSMDLRPHTSDIQIRFSNCDTNEGHIVHGAGTIPHGDRQNPLAPGPAAGQCGGTFTATLPGDTTGRGVYYMHDTQGGAQGRSINFGMTNPLAAAKATRADSFDRGPSNTGETCHTAEQ